MEFDAILEFFRHMPKQYLAVEQVNTLFDTVQTIKVAECLHVRMWRVLPVLNYTSHWFSPLFISPVHLPATRQVVGGIAKTGPKGCSSQMWVFHKGHPRAKGVLEPT